MNYEDVLNLSRPLMGKVCKSCRICDGKVCSNQIPGPGAKGSGTVAIENYNAWKKYRLNMDTLVENKKVDTTFEIFGQTFDLPVFAGPVGAVNNHYGDCFNDVSYNEILIKGCKENGILGFTGD